MALEINQIGAALGDIAEAALHLQTAVERLNTVEIAPSASANTQSAAIARIAASIEERIVNNKQLSWSLRHFAMAQVQQLRAL